MLYQCIADEPVRDTGMFLCEMHRHQK
jgi:hypothetical protein